MKFLRVWLVLVGLFPFGAGAVRADDRSIRDSLPTGELKDDAGFLPPDARERVLIRLQQFYTAGAPRGSAHRPNDIQLHVYTLRSAGRSSPDRTIENLYRSWRSVAKDQGDTFEREVILFVFLAERQVRITSGREIPPDIQEAVKGIEPDLPSLFMGQPEAALLAVIDRLAELAHVPATYRDPPPVPAEPGPIFGRWRWSDAVREALSQAIGRASEQAAHPIVLASDPELNFFTPRQGAEHLATAWPGRTLLLLSYYPTDSSDLVVVLRPADQVSGRFPKAEVDRIEREILNASKGDELERTLVRTIAEVGAISAGQPLTQWSPWKHPVDALLGGRDASSDARFAAAVGGLFKLALLIAVLAWIWYFLHDPREATVGLIYFLLSVFLGGGGGGGGGRGGSGFSGGGGDSGGGGASGSW